MDRFSFDAMASVVLSSGEYRFDASGPITLSWFGFAPIDIWLVCQHGEVMPFRRSAEGDVRLQLSGFLELVVNVPKGATCTFFCESGPPRRTGEATDDVSQTMLVADNFALSHDPTMRAVFERLRQQDETIRALSGQTQMTQHFARGTDDLDSAYYLVDEEDDDGSVSEDDTPPADGKGNPAPVESPPPAAGVVPDGTATKPVPA